jgi:hypothetical protein
MKWVLAPLLGLTAVALAFFVLWRLWRGRPVVLRGRWAPRVLRLVAIVLVVLGIGADEGRPVPVKPADRGGERRAERDPLPATVTAAAVGNWLFLQQLASPWARLKQEYTRLAARSADAVALKALRTGLTGVPAPLRSFLEADLEAREHGKSPPHVAPGRLVSALDQLEPQGYYDPWLTAYLWRQSASAGPDEGKELTELYARLYRHARVANALVRARARIKPVLQPPRAWMSKAGPAKVGMLREGDHTLAGAEVLGAAKVLFATSDIGTWQRDGLVILTVTKDAGAVTVLRGDWPAERQPGERVRLGRLDLLTRSAPGKAVALDHEWLGRLTLPAQRVVSVWDLPRCLSREGRARLEAQIEKGLDGDEMAAARLEQALPLAHTDLRQALARRPDAPAAARMRLILSLFDD